MTNRLKKGYLQWKCRRGTKELDVILNRFLDGWYDVLTDKELIEFDNLLNSQDTKLWYWLSGQESSESELIQKLILKIIKSSNVNNQAQ